MSYSEFVQCQVEHCEGLMARLNTPIEWNFIIDISLSYGNESFESRVQEVISVTLETVPVVESDRVCFSSFDIAYYPASGSTCYSASQLMEDSTPLSINTIRAVTDPPGASVDHRKNTDLHRALFGGQGEDGRVSKGLRDWLSEREYRPGLNRVFNIVITDGLHDPPASSTAVGREPSSWKAALMKNELEGLVGFHSSTLPGGEGYEVVTDLMLVVDLSDASWGKDRRRSMVDDQWDELRDQWQKPLASGKRRPLIFLYRQSVLASLRADLKRTVHREPGIKPCLATEYSRRNGPSWISSEREQEECCFQGVDKPGVVLLGTAKELADGAPYLRFYSLVGKEIKGKELLAKEAAVRLEVRPVGGGADAKIYKKYLSEFESEDSAADDSGGARVFEMASISVGVEKPSLSLNGYSPPFHVALSPSGEVRPFLEMTLLGRSLNSGWLGRQRDWRALGVAAMLLFLAGAAIRISVYWHGCGVRISLLGRGGEVLDQMARRISHGDRMTVVIPDHGCYIGDCSVTAGLPFGLQESRGGGRRLEIFHDGISLMLCHWGAQRLRGKSGDFRSTLEQGVVGTLVKLKGPWVSLSREGEGQVRWYGELSRSLEHGIDLQLEAPSVSSGPRARFEASQCSVSVCIGRWQRLCLCLSSLLMSSSLIFVGRAWLRRGSWYLEDWLLVLVGGIFSLWCLGVFSPMFRAGFRKGGFRWFRKVSDWWCAWGGWASCSAALANVTFFLLAILSHRPGIAVSVFAFVCFVFVLLRSQALKALEARLAAGQKIGDWMVVSLVLTAISSGGPSG